MDNLSVNGHRNTGITRVCLATMSYYPLYTGAAMRFQRYAPGLAKRGVEMSVFTQAVDSEAIAFDGLATSGGASHAPQPWEIPDAPPFEVIDGIPVHRVELPGGQRRKQAYFERLVEHCRKQAGEIDVVQFLSMSRSAASAVEQLRRMGVRTVLTQTMVNNLSRNPVQRFFQRRKRRARYSLVDWIVVSSGVMRQSIEALGVRRPISAILNGVDLQRFQPPESADDKASVRRSLGLDPSGEILLNVGPIGPRKGTDLLVEAFARLCRQRPNALLVLVGPRYDLDRPNLSAFRKQLEEAIAAAGAQDRVIFTGPVSNVPDYLKAADIFVFPSRREGFGNVVLEAMATALPIVMTPFIGLPAEFGTPGTHYALSRLDASALADGIVRLLADSEQRRRLGSAARRWAEKTFDVNFSIDQYARLYFSLARQKMSADAGVSG